MIGELSYILAHPGSAGFRFPIAAIPIFCSSSLSYFFSYSLVTQVGLAIAGYFARARSLWSFYFWPASN